MGILAALIPALIPAATDGIRGLIGKFTGGAGARPQNVGEVVQLMQADTARLQVVAQLDAPASNISVWVANIRALQRPTAVLLILGGYLYCLHQARLLPAGVLDTMAQYAEMVTFYLFGDRSYSYLKSGRA